MKIVKLVFILIAGILVVMLYNCEQKPVTKIIAHRGASGYVTENTLPAVERAVEMNSDAVEVDIWRTTDDLLVVYHDRNTARLANDSLVISESDYSALRALELPGGNHIPTLREVLEILPSDMEIFIEIKCCWEREEAGEVFPMLDDLLRETGTLEQATLISFNVDKLVEAKDYVPNVPLYWLTGEQQSASEIVDKVTKARVDGIDVHHSLISKELMKQAHSHNLDVYVWTVNDPERAGELARGYQVDGVTTDYPDRMMEAINMK